MEVARRIGRGDIFYYELVVPEGRNVFDIAAELEKLGLFPRRRFCKRRGTGAGPRSGRRPRRSKDISFRHLPAEPEDHAGPIVQDHDW